MEIRGRCPSCQAKFKVGTKYAGKKLPCPKCHALIDIPRESLQSSTIVPPPATEPPPAPPAVEPRQADEPVADSLTGFAIKTEPKKRAAHGRGSRQSRANPMRRPSRSMIFGGGGIAVIIITALALAVIFWPSATTKPNGIAKAAASKAKAPAAPAGETNPSVELPAAKASPPKREPQTALAKPATREFPLGSGAAPASIPGFDGWLQSLEIAKRQAAAEKKDILIVFGCSDSEPVTQQLARALKQPDAAKLIAEFVCIIIDFPRTPAGYELLEDGAQNRQLYEEYALQRLPALVMADAQGRAYCLVRKLDRGFDKLAADLAQWQSRKAERDVLLAGARTGTAEDQLAAAAKAIAWLEKNELWTLYRDDMAQWLKLAEQVDPENKKAILEAFFEPNWYIHASAVSSRDDESARKVAAELEPWFNRKFQDPDRGAKLHLVAARLLQSARRFDDGFKQMEHAAEYKPLDTALVEALRDVRQILEHRDVLGSGTGFLVSSAGHVLTNFHVAGGAGQVVVRLPGTKETVAAELVAQDETLDISLLKINLPRDNKYKPLALAAGSVRRGSAVAGFGYPLGDTLGTGLKLSAGTISAIPDESNNRYLLDLTVNPGNSGGPLCDRRANVVGMISEKTGTEGIADSYGLAIPAAELIKFLDAHLPPSAKRPAPDSGSLDLGWDKVDERVSSGVLMVVKKK